MLIAFICMPIITSCGSDGDDGPSGEDLKEAIQGSWKLNRATVKAMGQTITYDEDDIEDLKGELGVAGFYDQYLNFSGNYVNGTAYTIKSNKLNIPDWYGDIWATLSVTESTLKMKMSFEEEGIKISEELTYIRTNRGRSDGTETLSDTNCSIAKTLTRNM